MEENIFEMEYVINGEKYLITTTKVGEEAPVSNTTNESIVKMSYAEDKGSMTFSFNKIPEGMDVHTWAGIIRDYGIILTI